MIMKDAYVGNVIALEKLMQQRNILRVRTELMWLLTELSDDALEYVWRPIAYAYYWTDHHNPELLSEDDARRFRLIGAATNGSHETVRVMDIFRHGLLPTEQKMGVRKL